jgi:hypothetical protein
MTTFIEKQSDTQGLLALDEEALQTQTGQPERTRRKYVRGSRPARITKISIEHNDSAVTFEAKPRLKTGVQISVPMAEVEKSLIIATAHRAITIHHPGARAIIAKFDGEHSAHQISDEVNAPIEVVENVIIELLDAQLVDINKSKVRLHNRFQSKQGLHQSHRSLIDIRVRPWVKDSQPRMRMRTHETWRWTA